MSKLRRLVTGAVLAAGLALLATPAAAQCSMCKASVEGSAEGQRVSLELNRAILVLFAAPYLVVASCATLLFRRRIAAFLRKQLSLRRG